DEEILYREALALGLDRGDVIVRRRLVQKMELLQKSDPKLPSDAELEQYLETHRERYLAPARISFHQVFSKAPLALTPDQLQLRQPLGDSFLAGTSWTRRSQPELAASFGAAFAQKAMELPVGEWSPLRSAFGWHLVFVEEKLPPKTASLESARDRLRT